MGLSWLYGGDVVLYTPLVIKAIRYAYNAHHGQYDAGGVPYIFHPYHLAEQFSGETEVCAALLHDVIEDTDITLEELCKEFPNEVTDAVRLLTHNEDEDYYAYIMKLKDNSVAKAVKLADLSHNMDESRLTGAENVSEEQRARRREKYFRAYDILTD